MHFSLGSSQHFFCLCFLHSGRVAVVALDVLADLVFLLMAHLSRDNLALGLGNLLADALRLPRNGVNLHHGLLGPRLRLLFLLCLVDELGVGLVELGVYLVLQLPQLLGHGPRFAGADGDVHSIVPSTAAAATGRLFIVRERRGVLLRIIVLDRVGDNTDLNILADLLQDLLALLVVVGLADVLQVRLALLIPDLLAFLLVLALLLYGELAFGDLEGVALVRQDQLAFLLVLGLAHLVGDPLAGPV